MHYYQFNIGDYRRDAAHLTLLEHGIYRQLIDMYYLNESPIPKETQVVYRRLCAVSEEEQKAVDMVLSDFFEETSEGYRHSRCDADIEKYQQKRVKNAENGKKGGRPRKQENQELSENGEPGKTQSVYFGNPNDSQKKPNQEPITNNQEVKESKTNVLLVASAADNCPHQEIINLYHEILPMCPTVRQWTPARQKFLRQRWKEDPKRQSLEWWRRFFVYISESDFLTGKVNPQPGRVQFIADLEWIVRPSNFIKIIEKGYRNSNHSTAAKEN